MSQATDSPRNHSPALSSGRMGECYAPAPSHTPTGQQWAGWANPGELGGLSGLDRKAPGQNSIRGAGFDRSAIGERDL
jgi:hypothetical protein